MRRDKEQQREKTLLRKKETNEIEMILCGKNVEGLRTTKRENSIKKQTNKRDRNDPLWEK